MKLNAMLRGRAVLLIAAAAFSLPCHAEPYRDARRHWSFEPPPGWYPITQENLDLANAEVNSRVPRKHSAYVAGFTVDPEGGLVYPYMFVQYTNMLLDGKSYEDIARVVGGGVIDNAMDKVSDAMKDVGEIALLEKPRVDPARNRLTLHARADIDGVGVIRSTAVGFFGKEGIVQFVANVPEDEVEEFAPVFERSLQTFAFDPGHQFTGSAERKNAVFGSCAGLATSVILVVAIVRRRRRARAQQSSSSPGSVDGR